MVGRNAAPMGNSMKVLTPRPTPPKKIELMDKENMVYTCSRILFSLIKKKILQYAIIWMNLEDVMLNEIS